MGYGVSGDFTITVSKFAAIQMALSPDSELPPGVGDTPDRLTDCITESIYGEIYSEEKNEETGIATISGYIGEKWSDSAEDGFRWLAEKGCGIDASFRGEDDYSWEYSSDLDGNQLKEDSLELVKVSQSLLIPPAEAISKACEDIDLDGLAIPESLREALKALAKVG